MNSTALLSVERLHANQASVACAIDEAMNSHIMLSQHPVPLTQAEVIQEVAAVQRAGRQLCPLHIALERIVATSSGNILACWQVVAGSDPAAIRRYMPSASLNLCGCINEAIPSKHSIPYQAIVSLQHACWPSGESSLCLFAGGGYLAHGAIYIAEVLLRLSPVMICQQNC